MPRKSTHKQSVAASQVDPFEAAGKKTSQEVDSEVHLFGTHFVCDTEDRGHPTPKGRSPLELVVEASEGFIPLWAQDTTIRWRFRDSSMSFFKNPEAAKASIRALMGEALLAWGDSAPVKFTERNDAWDFEIVMRKADDCQGGGCVLASSFFPDAGRHSFYLYPILFRQSKEEQLETFEHELGHTFGLRHFFAQISETAFPSEIFGTHKPFSIMNYGSQSRLTADDTGDLRRLYALAWSGQLTQINGTPIKFVKPFHTVGAPTQNVVAFSPMAPAPQPYPLVAAVNRFGRQLTPSDW